MSRNAPCPCGSGKRFKHCCGRHEGFQAPARFRALAAQQAGSLALAEDLYREALAERPDDFDAMHMLGVICLERMRYGEALELIMRAAEGTDWAVPQIRHNLGLVLSRMLAQDANRRQAELLKAFSDWQAARRERRSAESPLVSVVLPVSDGARFVAQAIGSIAEQTYAALELVVVDDGSAGATLDALDKALTGVRIPTRVFRRDPRGSVASLNDGAAVAEGKYVAFLDADDRYVPDRVASLVDEVARAGVPWGLSLVSAIGDGARPDVRAPQDQPDVYWQKQRALLSSDSNSFAFVGMDVAVTAGNLFVEREFFRSLEGFRESRVGHDWDFCLRASVLAEPIVVRRPLYFYRRSAAAEAAERGGQFVEDAMPDTLEQLLSGPLPCRNPLAPQSPGNRTLLLHRVMRAGMAQYLPVPVLRAVAAKLREEIPAQPSPAKITQRGCTAIVVLGMHRSGTSALSRVLNLCGAALPEKLRPPNPNNVKGFWEPEEIVNLDEHLMHRLGGAWDRIDFALPTGGSIVEEFEVDAAALLASEYGDARTILIKDPRIGAIAPLWHRALSSAGFRPVYVVPVRDPREVARSLHARGDMSVETGLALWSAYSQRIAAFAGDVPDVVHVRFVDLLADWRAVATRIATRLRVDLDIATRAHEVDRFLEPELRRQRADEDPRGQAPPVAMPADVAGQYRALLERCERDANEAPPSGAGRAVLPVAGKRPAALATATFVLCIENNGIRDQALMLCESIREFGGAHRDAVIQAYSPRAGLAVDRETRARLSDLRVDYSDEPLNVECPEYGPANRVVAGAFAEARSIDDFMVVLDSDAVFLDEPKLPLEADAAGRPVDEKGSASSGPGDPFDAYWQALCEMCGIPIDRLPYVRSTIGGERVRASYNAGLLVARRSCRIFGRAADLFLRSVRTGLRPYRGSGIDIVASTGSVGRGGSEYWGSSQAVHAIAVWATTDRVIDLPASYNVPLHMLGKHGEITNEWLRRPPVHVHYHDLFSGNRHEIAMDLLGRLGVAPDRLKWLARRVPFSRR